MIAGVALVFGGFGRSAAGATPAQVDAAIKKSKAFIYGQMKGENWEQVPKAGEGGNADVKARQWGGLTAMSVYALLAAGENPQDPRLAPAIEWLKTAPIEGHYAAGMRAQVWPFLKSERDAKLASKPDFKIFLDSLIADGANKGLYGYYTDHDTGKPQPDYADHSVSQYGVLGMWACEQAGQEVPSLYWQVVDAKWKADQLPDGGWGYKPGDGKARGTMTAAGVATLFITQDYLLIGNKWDPCHGGARDPHIEKGLAWMDKHVAEMLDEGPHYYYGLYGIERIGVASGRKYFGTVDWYRAGANELVDRQKPNGSWGTLPDTVFSTLFLVRGRAPVVMNKLEYHETTEKPGAKPQEEPWNERPRDVANFAHWSGRQVERYLNWQIVNLKVAANDLHDAPILYISGSAAPEFDAKELKKLRQFVEEGGMILGNADCGSDAFAKSFRELGQKLFPKYEFRQLPESHPIYTNQQFRPAKWKTRPKVETLGNGVRELMILVPEADPGRAWQTRSEKTREELYQLIQNIFLYAIDKAELRYRGETYVINANPRVEATREMTVVRLRAGENPDPEPGGWRRLNHLLHNQHKLDLNFEAAKPGEGKLKDAKFAHLTGTTKFAFTPEQRDEIKAFCAAGGTLVIDAAGGSTEFADAAEAEMNALFGSPAGSNGPPGTVLEAGHAVYTKGAKIDGFGYRPFVKGKLTGKLDVPRVRGIEQGGRVVIFYSREDLSCGMVGNPVDGIMGYSPDTATDIMRNIVLYAAPKAATGVTPKPPAPKPATPKPTTPKPGGGKK